MSAKRQADMAIIEAGLPANALYIDGKPIMGPDNKPLTSGEQDDVPSLAPGPVGNLTEPEKAPDKSKDYADYVRRTHQQGLTLEQQQQQRQSLLRAQVQRTVQGAGRALNGFQNGVGSLSMLGGIGLPLATIIVMLMLLIPVNGRTRFSWLWGVVTGTAGLPSAVVSGGVAGPGGTSSTDSGNFSTGTAKGGGGPSGATTMFMPMGLYLSTGLEGVQL